MNHLFSVVLLLLLVPQNQKQPDTVNQLPEHVRESATVIFTGTW